MTMNKGHLFTSKVLFFRCITVVIITCNKMKIILGRIFWFQNRENSTYSCAKSSMTDKKRDWQSHFLINSDIITYILHHYELVRGKSLIFSLSSSSIISETTHWFPTIYDLNDFLNIRFTGFPQNVRVSSLFFR